VSWGSGRYSSACVPQLLFSPSVPRHRSSCGVCVWLGCDGIISELSRVACHANRSVGSTPRSGRGTSDRSCLRPQSVLVVQAPVVVLGRWRHHAGRSLNSSNIRISDIRCKAGRVDITARQPPTRNPISALYPSWRNNSSSPECRLRPAMYNPLTDTGRELIMVRPSSAKLKRRKWRFWDRVSATISRTWASRSCADVPLLRGQRNHRAGRALNEGVREALLQNDENPSISTSA